MTNKTLPRLALWDMDGTLANDSHRAPLYIRGAWSEYWNRDQVMKDPLFPQAEAWLRSFESQGWQIGILTARLDRHNRESTEEWLTNKGIVANPIFLRPDAFDWMRPPEFKTLVVKNLIVSGAYDRVVLFDNDPEVVAAVRAECGEKTAVHCTWDMGVTDYSVK